MALIPADTGILAETLFFHDEVKAIPKGSTQSGLSEQALAMGKTIISSMKERFNPSKYHDEYRAWLWKIIQVKTNNQEIPQSPVGRYVSMINMLAAFQKMLEQTKRNHP